MAKQNNNTQGNVDPLKAIKIADNGTIEIQAANVPQNDNPVTPNLGWLYYKDYYRDEDGKYPDFEREVVHIKNKDDRKKELEKVQKAFFDKKNKKLKIQKTSKINKTKSDTAKLTFKTGARGLLIGTGIKHEVHSKGEFKLGIQFDYTTGMPYIPGSSVKGMLRSCFTNTKKDLGETYKTERQNLMSEILDEENNSEELKNRLETFLGKKVENETYFKLYLEHLENLLFEGTDKNDEPIKMSERTCFYDAFPSKNNQNLFDEDIITPHKEELKNPTPLAFMTIAKNVEFEFSFLLHDNILMTKDEQKEIFRILIETFGIGAKRRKGYGAMIHIG